MKVLVLSDSHGRAERLLAAVAKEKDCSHVFFLGDGLSDLEKCEKLYPEKKYTAVKGNCDRGYSYDDAAYVCIEKYAIVASHGDKYSVKITLGDLLKHAESVLAKIVFYGHTHVPDFHYDSAYDIFVLNPGSIANGNYAVADITEKGIEAVLKSL